MNILANCIEELSIGNPQKFHNLTMTPLFGESSVDLDYLLLDEALEKDVIELSEVSESGSVPNLRVLNKSAKRILLLDGEELIGAKQNRILNVSVMVPPEETIIIPVSCVEAGRWHRRSRHFSSANRVHFAEGRARNARHVTDSLRSRGSARGSQGEVWSTISEKARRMNAVSGTSASDHIFRTHRRSLNMYLDVFNSLPNQRGAIFSVEGGTTGVDFFDSNKALSSSFKKLVESYALDAIDLYMFGANGKYEFNSKSLLEEIGSSQVKNFPAVGEGENVRLVSDTLAGGALVVEGRDVHLSAFYRLEN